MKKVIKTISPKNNFWVISVGGSRIIPEKVDYKFVRDFHKLIQKHPSQKFVAVTGGGSTARKYISGLRKLHKKARTQSKIGIAVTRLNASFLMRVFGAPANETLPKSMKKVKTLLQKNHIVFCGALRFNPKQTSDGTSADIAAYLKCPFINLTNVQGLYTSNPKTSKDAKFIKKMTWKAFNQKAQKIKYRAGQHFVLDQDAAKTIMNKKIPTYIVGSLSDVDKILSNKSFKGSLISG